MQRERPSTKGPRVEMCLLGQGKPAGSVPGAVEVMREEQKKRPER
jgi:hypothetical protein